MTEKILEHTVEERKQEEEVKELLKLMLRAYDDLYDYYCGFDVDEFTALRKLERAGVTGRLNNLLVMDIKRLIEMFTGAQDWSQRYAPTLVIVTDTYYRATHFSNLLTSQFVSENSRHFKRATKIGDSDYVGICCEDPFKALSSRKLYFDVFTEPLRSARESKRPSVVFISKVSDENDYFDKAVLVMSLDGKYSQNNFTLIEWMQDWQGLQQIADLGFDRETTEKMYRDLQKSKENASSRRL